MLNNDRNRFLLEVFGRSSGIGVWGENQVREKRKLYRSLLQQESPTSGI